MRLAELKDFSRGFQYLLVKMADIGLNMFFRRVYRTYFSSKGLEIPKDHKDIKEESVISDIKYMFVERLNNKRLQRELMTMDIGWNELPSQARRLEEVMKRLDTLGYEKFENSHKNDS